MSYKKLKDNRIPANIDSTELGHLNGVTSDIQTQINEKSDTDHNHSGTYEPVNEAILKNNVAIGCNGQQLQDFDAEVIEKIDSYTLTDGDRGKVIYVNNISAKVITIPDSLGVGFTCTVMQIGAGDVTFTASGSMNVRNRQSHTKTAGQYAAATLVVYVANNCILQGDTA